MNKSITQVYMCAQRINAMPANINHNSEKGSANDAPPVAAAALALALLDDILLALFPLTTVGNSCVEFLSTTI